MRRPLKTFTEFSHSILPHEIDYLLYANQLQDEDRVAILRQIRHNIEQQPPGDHFDVDIDKRTYSHLKNWIQKQLEGIDVDRLYEWMSHLDIKIINDRISPDEERQLLRTLKNYQHPAFFFTKFYEVLRNYSNFLLIRLRYKDHQTVNQFLEQYQTSYLEHQEVQERLQNASRDIVEEYTMRESTKSEWREWLSQVFENGQIQGYFRYQSLIRLHYIDLLRENNKELLERYEKVGSYFKEGKFYSKRLVLNFYHNQMLLHHKARDYERALQFGYLSIRAKNHDYLLYVNNLCDVLVQLGRYEEGLELLRGAAKEAKDTNNYFNRVGFVAFYMRCQIGVGQARSAVSYGSSFLAAYKKEILKYRWYRFFRTYLEALLRTDQSRDMLRLLKKHRLLEMEAEKGLAAGKIPAFKVLAHTARYLAGEMDADQFQEALAGYPPARLQLLLAGDLDGLSGP